MVDKEIKVHVHRRVIRMVLFPIIQMAKNDKSVQTVPPVYNNGGVGIVLRKSLDHYLSTNQNMNQIHFRV